jgi:hypothetical protein
VPDLEGLGKLEGPNCDVGGGCVRRQDWLKLLKKVRTVEVGPSSHAASSEMFRTGYNLCHLCYLLCEWKQLVKDKITGPETIKVLAAHRFLKCVGKMPKSISTLQ